MHLQGQAQLRYFPRPPSQIELIVIWQKMTTLTLVVGNAIEKLKDSNRES